MHFLWTNTCFLEAGPSHFHTMLDETLHSEEGKTFADEISQEVIQTTTIKDSAIVVATLNMRSFSGGKKSVKAHAIFQLPYDTLILTDPQMGNSGLNVLKNNWQQEMKIYNSWCTISEKLGILILVKKAVVSFLTT